MMRTISIINLKGGVAKTMTAVNMAHILAVIHKQRVLLVDNDKQGNSSKMFGLHNYNKKTIADVMIKKNPNMPEIIQKTHYENLDMITANMNLINAIQTVMFMIGTPQQRILKEALKQVAEDYDYCIIDNAPDLNISTFNSLVASQDIIIPIKLDDFAFDGLKELSLQIAQTKAEFNKEIKIAGCLITLFQKNKVNIRSEEWLRNSAYPVFKNRIRKTEKVDESTFENKPILEHSKRCGAAKDYKNFVLEYVPDSNTKEGD